MHQVDMLNHLRNNVYSNTRSRYHLDSNRRISTRQEHEFQVQDETVEPMLELGLQRLTEVL